MALKRAAALVPDIEERLAALKSAHEAAQRNGRFFRDLAQGGGYTVRSCHASNTHGWRECVFEKPAAVALKSGKGAEVRVKSPYEAFQLGEGTDEHRNLSRQTDMM